MKGRARLLLLISLWCICAGACSNPSSSPPPALSVPTASAGNVTITGRFVSSTTSEPVRNTTVRLAEVFRFGDEAAVILDVTRGPSTMTDDDGRFVFANVPAREYVLFLSAGEHANAAITEAPDKAKIWDARAGGVLDIGTVRVQWP